tara:strand:+ start:347 stop:604 length:258 start_codon:yes stop_codon:yes gene_type:complete
MLSESLSPDKPREQQTTQKAMQHPKNPGNKKGVAWRPLFIDLVGTIGLEPTTPTMSRWCSNQLSYVPSMGAHSTQIFSGVNKFFR